MSIVNANASILLILNGIFDEGKGWVTQVDGNMTFCAENKDMEISYTWNYGDVFCSWFHAPLYKQTFISQACV